MVFIVSRTPRPEWRTGKFRVKQSGEVQSVGLQQARVSALPLVSCVTSYLFQTLKFPSVKWERSVPRVAGRIE